MIWIDFSEFSGSAGLQVFDRLALAKGFSARGHSGQGQFKFCRFNEVVGDFEAIDSSALEGFLVKPVSEDRRTLVDDAPSLRSCLQSMKYLLKEFGGLIKERILGRLRPSVLPACAPKELSNSFLATKLRQGDIYLRLMPVCSDRQIRLLYASKKIVKYHFVAVDHDLLPAILYPETLSEESALRATLHYYSIGWLADYVFSLSEVSKARLHSMLSRLCCPVPQGGNLLDAVPPALGELESARMAALLKSATYDWEPLISAGYRR